MGGKKGGKAKLSFPTRYLLLNSSNSGRGTEGTCMLCFLPLDFSSKKLPGTSLFRHEASTNQPIQVKSTMVATSSNEVIVTPKMVGTGHKNCKPSIRGCNKLLLCITVKLVHKIMRVFYSHCFVFRCACDTRGVAICHVLTVCQKRHDIMRSDVYTREFHIPSS